MGVGVLAWQVGQRINNFNSVFAYQHGVQPVKNKLLWPWVARACPVAVPVAAPEVRLDRYGRGRKRGKHIRLEAVDALAVAPGDKRG